MEICSYMLSAGFYRLRIYGGILVSQPYLLCIYDETGE